MDGSIQLPIQPEVTDLGPALDRILELQTAAGKIDWFENGPWDPWNHTESAMALCAMGKVEDAARAFAFLVETQRSDGAWFGEYGNARAIVDRDFISREPAPAFLDSNFCAYPAVGVAHYYKSTGDLDRLKAWWPMVDRALDFVLSLQRADGTICWSAEAWETDEEDALLAGNASIAKSLECGLYLAKTLGKSRPHWHHARQTLLSALRDRPSAFDRRETGHRFAMDWYYPVLSGALEPAIAAQRIEARWHDFVAPDLGCLCVSDEPWITVAETAELALALISIGDEDRASELLSRVETVRDDDGVFWMGWQSEENIYWPRERPSWTQAAVILAADALSPKHPGSRLLVEPLT